MSANSTHLNPRNWPCIRIFIFNPLVCTIVCSYQCKRIIAIRITAAVCYLVLVISDVWILISFFVLRSAITGKCRYTRQHHSRCNIPETIFFNIVNTLLCKLNNLSIFWITLPVICIYNSIYYLICKYSFVNFYLLYSFYWNYLHIMYKKADTTQYLLFIILLSNISQSF